jgi:hypothetical protein
MHSKVSSSQEMWDQKMQARLITVKPQVRTIDCPHVHDSRSIKNWGSITNLASNHSKWKVPWCDGTYHAHRLPTTHSFEFNHQPLNLPLRKFDCREQYTIGNKDVEKKMQAHLFHHQHAFRRKWRGNDITIHPFPFLCIVLYKACPIENLHVDTSVTPITAVTSLQNQTTHART